MNVTEEIKQRKRKFVREYDKKIHDLGFTKAPCSPALMFGVLQNSLKGRYESFQTFSSLSYKAQQTELRVSETSLIPRLPRILAAK